jgi:hypothetical protein
MMMTEMDIETSVYYVHLTRLIAREDFIKFTRRESTKTYTFVFVLPRGSRVRFPVEAGNFSLHRRVQNGSGAHPPSSPMGTRGFFPGGKAAGA